MFTCAKGKRFTTRTCKAMYLDGRTGTYPGSTCLIITFYPWPFLLRYLVLLLGDKHVPGGLTARLRRRVE